MEKKGMAAKIKIVLRDGKKFFCHWDVDIKGDLLSQGCRAISDDPDVRL